MLEGFVIFQLAMLGLVLGQQAYHYVTAPTEPIAVAAPAAAAPVVPEILVVAPAQNEAN